MGHSPWELTTPVAVFIYRRPEKTRRVFQRISEVEPPRLYVIADGPKKGNPGEEKVCQKTREIIDVDWECEVNRNFADSNMGLKERTVSGLDWVFEDEEEIIFLEDDVLLNDSGFRFLQEMLRRFKDDERVMHVAAYNRMGTWKESLQDYHFSHYAAVWGCGLWRSVWRKYDPEMESWNSEEVQERVRDVLADDDHFIFRKNMFEMAMENEDSWSVPLNLTMLKNSGLSVVPAKNFVTNVGFGDEATHTTRHNPDYATQYTQNFPIRENDFVAVDRGYDEEVFQMKSPPGIVGRAKKVPEIYREEGITSLIKQGWEVGRSHISGK